MISTQLAAVRSASPEGLTNKIIVAGRKHLTPLIKPRADPNPNTQPVPAAGCWQPKGRGVWGAAVPKAVALLHASPRLGLPLLLEAGDVYGEFASLGDTLFLHVAIVTATIIKLRLNLVEEMDLSDAIIYRPRCFPAVPPSPQSEPPVGPHPALWGAPQGTPLHSPLAPHGPSALAAPWAHPPQPRCSCLLCSAASLNVFSFPLHFS